MQIRLLIISGLFNLYCFTAIAQKQDVKALYVPLADHYAAIVAYEKFASDLKYANYQIEQVKNWDLLQAKFLAGQADLAFVMAPLALSMYNSSPTFKWLGLMHRDGNGLAVNKPLLAHLRLAPDKQDRLPNEKLANGIKQLTVTEQQRVIIGVPHLKSTHAVILHAFFKQHGLSLSLRPNHNDQLLAVKINPSETMSYLRGQNNLNQPVAIEQSLPWIDLAETQNQGSIAWYSKDVLKTEHGHIDCITLGSNHALTHKTKAIKEVLAAIKQAGVLIETARNANGPELQEVIQIIQKHIPSHSTAAIIASLDPELRIINYDQLDIDMTGIKMIMNLALESGVIKQPVDLNEFSVTSFGPYLVTENE